MFLHSTTQKMAHNMNIWSLTTEDFLCANTCKDKYITTQNKKQYITTQNNKRYNKVKVPNRKRSWRIPTFWREAAEMEKGGGACPNKHEQLHIGL